MKDDREQEVPKCATCIEREFCKETQIHTWCLRWRRKHPTRADHTRDPNDAWNRCEDVVFE